MSNDRRPYLKYLIAGGVVCGEGGSLLPSGLQLLFFSNGMFDGLFGSLLGGFDPFRAIGIAFTIIGAISLCIGLPLLYRGYKERQLWVKAHESKYDGYPRPIPQAQPMIQLPSPSSVHGRFCAACGAQLPSLPNIKFCAKCGEPV